MCACDGIDVIGSCSVRFSSGIQLMLSIYTESIQTSTAAQYTYSKYMAHLVDYLLAVCEH